MRLRTFAAIAAVVVLIVVLGSVIFYNSAPVGTAQGRVVSVNSWTGGDLTRYYNVTVSYDGHLYTQVITCDYYTVNSTLPLATTLSGAVNGFETMDETGAGTGMPVGCQG